MGVPGSIVFSASLSGPLGVGQTRQVGGLRGGRNQALIADVTLMAGAKGRKTFGRPACLRKWDRWHLVPRRW